MVQKRQLAEAEYDVSPKHLKLENSCQLVPCLEFPATDVPLKSCISGIAECCFFKETSESPCHLESGKIMNLPEKDVGCRHGRLSDLSCTGSTMGEDVKSEAANPLKPRTLIQPEDAYSNLFLFPPLKEVPVGSEYQAVIPEWCDSSKASTLYHTSDANSIMNKFMGTCVIPMHEGDSTICNDDAVGRGRTDCCCEDSGSLRCVRQHIEEAREKLRGNIGHERFSELGFCSMGDVVAGKWTEEDEQLFHDIVYSNPASLGKNFWDRLAEAFPSQTNEEIVSYYFNVFVLQRRAEQNRCDPMNADSDDDEWQGSEPSDEDEENIYGFSMRNPVFDYKENMGFLHGIRGGVNLYETDPAMLLNSCSLEKTMVDESCDFEDDSSTSSDHSNLMLEPLDSKMWDVGSFSLPRNKTDFLSTGGMIEEVFGVESWNITMADNSKGPS